MQECKPPWSVMDAMYSWLKFTSCHMYFGAWASFDWINGPWYLISGTNGTMIVVFLASSRYNCNSNRFLHARPLITQMPYWFKLRLGGHISSSASHVLHKMRYCSMKPFCMPRLEWTKPVFFALLVKPFWEKLSQTARYKLHFIINLY